MSKLDARMLIAFGVAKNFGSVKSGDGGNGGGLGGGDGGGGARAATVVGGTISDMFNNPALVNFAAISVVSVTVNLFSRFVVSAIVVASTVNSIFKTELAAASFLRAVTSVSFVIFMAPVPTPKYSAMPVLNSAFFASSNSAEE